ncbi:hypothetical protein EH165_14755 [Nakamurella antarctica]|uniref:Uncharacterized protein n=1 Tax=Nakamurella antarctica TaxID=1902245 RepID=A0A3G8ZPE0_9ACTN|nr:hypothetical protein [Nakamurella antarctica]AZI59212.1 hypothetical protein EH165_14755 [Nakamurella antarctica]
MKYPRRLKSIDLYPNPFPDGNAPTAKEEQYNWVSHTVVNLYNRQLTKLGGVPAMASHLRVFIRENQDNLRLGDPIIRTDLGVFEAAFSGIDEEARTLIGFERNLYLLNWLQNILLTMAKARDWDRTILDKAYQGCIDEGLEFTLESKPKLSPDRKYKSSFKIAFDDLDTVVSLRVLTRSGIEVAAQQARDRNSIMAPWAMRELIARATWRNTGIEEKPWIFSSGWLGWHFSVEVG